MSQIPDTRREFEAEMEDYILQEFQGMIRYGSTLSESARQIAVVIARALGRLCEMLGIWHSVE